MNVKLFSNRYTICLLLIFDHENQAVFLGYKVIISFLHHQNFRYLENLSSILRIQLAQNNALNFFPSKMANKNEICTQDIQILYGKFNLRNKELVGARFCMVQNSRNYYRQRKIYCLQKCMAHIYEPRVPPTHTEFTFEDKKKSYFAKRVCFMCHHLTFSHCSLSSNVVTVITAAVIVYTQ